ncbi:uncharacterized protein [Nicotiana tomentosiformis]|uniref:uncharacterized protein n=1 Tax=Nicotiana tomentosiformis TaxID=4098 RepID=UPI00388C393E
MKAQVLADHLAENLVDDEYQPLNTYFQDEEVNSAEVVPENINAWKMFFDRVVNAKGVGIGAILISLASQHYPAMARLRFFCTNNTTEYEACIMCTNMAIDLDVQELLIMENSDLIIRQARGEWKTRDIKLIQYRQHVEDLEYPEQASGDQKRTIKRLASSFFLSGEILYKRTPDLNMLRCVDSREAERIMNEVHIGIHIDLIHMLPSELHPISAPWPFVTWGMDVIGPIKTKASNGHRFILVAISYFTKWIQAVTFKVVTKKAVADFVHSNTICHFGIPKTIISDNAANLNIHLMREVYQQFKIMHRNSTPYRPKANSAVEAANKNIKKILQKMVQGSKQRHESCLLHYWDIGQSCAHQ